MLSKQISVSRHLLRPTTGDRCSAVGSHRARLQPCRAKSKGTKTAQRTKEQTGGVLSPDIPDTGRQNSNSQASSSGAGTITEEARQEQPQSQTQASSSQAGSATEGARQEQPQSQASTDSLSSQLRSSRVQQTQTTGLAGALEEIQLIEWPSLLKAAKDTVTVLVLLGGVTVFLFVANTFFADLSSRFLQGPVTQPSSASRPQTPPALTPPELTQKAKEALKAAPQQAPKAVEQAGKQITKGFPDLIEPLQAAPKQAPLLERAGKQVAKSFPDLS